MNRWQRNLLIGVGTLAVLAGTAASLINPAVLVGQQQQKNDDLIAEQMAYHVGTLAYLYGYPIVDMLTQMHNETHRIAPDQPVYAPVNSFFRFKGLVTPANSGNFRAPNSDTLYFTAWYDLNNGPVVLATPNTQGRYFTIAVTNLYAEASHIGRRTTGTKARRFALTAPDWSGELPEDVTSFPVETKQGWLLGRMYVGGPSDLAAAEALVNEFALSPLVTDSAADMSTLNESTATPSGGANHVVNTPDRKSVPTEIDAVPMAPHDSLQFFTLLDKALRELPERPGEAALRAQFEAIGLGGDTPFDPNTASEATQNGLERALVDGAELVEAATRRTIESYNGWMISMDIGRYGFKYLHRASVARGGYGNLPEESLYPAAVFDANGELMSGDRHYRITFSPEQLPPVNGFWSVSAYDLWNLRMVNNPIDRFAIGDRTEGLRYNEDGSLTLLLQHEEPAEGPDNWLPIPEGYFMLVMRLYEPDPDALDHSWVPPRIEVSAE